VVRPIFCFEYVESQKGMRANSPEESASGSDRSKRLDSSESTADRRFSSLNIHGFADGKRASVGPLL